MIEKWSQSFQPLLEYTTRPSNDRTGRKIMTYRCVVCGVSWSYKPGNEHVAMWNLHLNDHKKTDAIIAQSIAIKLGAF